MWASTVVEMPTGLLCAIASARRIRNDDRDVATACSFARPQLHPRSRKIANNTIAGTPMNQASM